ncbi:unnamed protein product, partial [Ectocarpus sp. 4 AP-2014]
THVQRESKVSEKARQQPSVARKNAVVNLPHFDRLDCIADHWHLFEMRRKRSTSTSSSSGGSVVACGGESKRKHVSRRGHRSSNSNANNKGEGSRGQAKGGKRVHKSKKQCRTPTRGRSGTRYRNDSSRSSRRRRRSSSS